MTEQNSPAVEVKIGDWLTAAWELFKRDAVKYSLTMLISLLLSAVTCFILLGPMTVSLYRCFIKKARGQDFSYGELFDGLKLQFLPALVFTIGIMIACGIVSGAMAFIPVIGQMVASLIGLVVAPIMAYTLMEMAVAEAPVEIGSLIDRAKNVFDRIKTQYGMLIVWFLVVNVITFAGAMVCCVGMIVTASFGALAVCISYLAIFKTEPIPAVPENPAPQQQ